MSPGLAEINSTSGLPFGVAGNVTMINGEPFVPCDDRDSCIASLGHNRGECYAVVHVGSPSGPSGRYCACWNTAFEVAEPYEPSCFNATCISSSSSAGTNGTTTVQGGCLQISPLGYWWGVAGAVNMLGCAVTLLIFLRILTQLIIRGRIFSKCCRLNAAGSTLVVGSFGLIFHLLWLCEAPVILANRDVEYGLLISNFVWIPLSAFFNMSSYLNVSLVWIEVAIASKTVAKASSNLQRRSLIFVVVCCSVFAAGLIVIAITGQTQFSPFLAVIFGILVTSSFLTGGRMLAGLLHQAEAQARGKSVKTRPRSPRIVSIIGTARKMGTVIGLFAFTAIISAVARIISSKGLSWAVVFLLTYEVGVKGTVWFAQLVSVIYIARSTRRLRYQNFEDQTGGTSAETRGGARGSS